jgi:hypothetical protein
MKGGYIIQGEGRNARVIFSEDEKIRIKNYNSHINSGRVPTYPSQYIRDILFPTMPEVHKDIANYEIREVLGWNSWSSNR